MAASGGTVSERGDDVSIQIENGDSTLATSFRQKLQTVSPLSSKCCIHKVPRRLRSSNDTAYTPQVISIGPFHRSNESLQVMEEHKWRYLHAFLDWYPRIALEDYVIALKELEESGRQCYAEPIKLGSDEFVEMMLLDGFFIIVLLLKTHFNRWEETRDPIYYTTWMAFDIKLDMLLLENQIPFFVLERLFHLSEVRNQVDQCPSLLQLITRGYAYFLKKDEIPETISRSEIKHLLDFVRSCFLPSSITVLPQSDRRWNSTPSATELHGVGVRFKVSESNCLFDISFRNEVLEIPLLEIDESTELFFRNLIAWEQCQTENLINTPKDVDLLVRYGIIENRVGGNEDVSRLFNNIGKGVITKGNKFYFYSLCKKLNAHSKTRHRKWMATLKRDYFNNPWAIISFQNAILILILTFTQTFFSILSNKS